MTAKALTDPQGAPAIDFAAKLIRQTPLAFHDPESGVHEDISAIVATGEGESVWIGCDEGARLERLTARRDKTGAVTGYDQHKQFDLHAYFDLPVKPAKPAKDEAGEPKEKPPAAEADVEGLAISDGYLWVAGSHSLKRKKPKADDGEDEALERLTTVEREANRFLLGRIPLVAGEAPGVLTLAKTAPAIDSGRKRRAGTLRMKNGHNALSRRLAKDIHLGPFLAIPSKDNGFDIEGLGVDGDRVFLGLRGPVLRGWAVVIEIAVEATRQGRLKLKPVGEDGELYLKHFVRLDGLGIRSLMIRGSDIVLLAGPTMDLDGPVRMFRWRGALGAQASSVVPEADVTRLVNLPFGEGVDHAEGATVIRLRPDGPHALVVAYDSPAPARILATGDGVLADMFEAPDGL